MASANYAESSLELNRHIVNLLDSLSALHGLTEISLQDNDESRLLKLALEKLMSNQDMERCSIFLLHEDNTLTNGAGLDWDDMLKGIAHPGEKVAPAPHPRNKVPYRRGEGIMGHAAESGAIVHCRSCLDDPQFKKFGVMDKPVQGSLMCIPIGCEERVLGVLNVYHPEPDFFNLWHERLLLLFCKTLGRLLVNHRLMHHLNALVEERTEALAALSETLESLVQQEVAKNLAQERLLIQQSRLAAMGEMIGNIAHQWRQPINALALLLGNIRDAHEYGEMNKEYLEREVRIGQELIQKMSGTIDDFRNFFKPDKQKQVFRVCEAVEEAIKLLGHSFRNHNIQIEFAPCNSACAALGHANEFSQVVLNVLSNAKDAILAREVAGAVHIDIEVKDNFAVLSVRDNGGGIPQEILGQVFDPYFTTREKGTGIGLYMSKMIMGNMGGDLALRNTGEGVEALISLPLAEDAP